MLDDTPIRTYQRLQSAIWHAQQHQQAVPCTNDPDQWDEDNAQAIAACRTCPALHQCRAYALTGAVTHGIVAAMSMADLADHRRAQQRRQRRLHTLKTAA